MAHTVWHILTEAHHLCVIIPADGPFCDVYVHLSYCRKGGVAGGSEAVKEIVQGMRLTHDSSCHRVHHRIAYRPHPCIRPGEDGNIQDDAKVSGRCREHQTNEDSNGEGRNEECGCTVPPGEQIGEEG